MQMNRRNLLAAGGLGAVAGAAALAAPMSIVSGKAASQLAAAKMPVPFRQTFAKPQELKPDSTGTNADGQPVNYYTVTEKAVSKEIVPGILTPMLTYNGLFPGPTIRMNQGTEAVVRMRNQLPAKHPVL